ncbi:MAG: Cof-type HAD-IIB family hydrolase [Verrucomicrobiales bacterium]|nr:Cof-type HAD-IIB family hydrolase [Verrucomicrobiales bacterium]
MSSPIRILSTDFDGTLHAEHEDPPVPRRLQDLIGRLQAGGVAWVINTGRDLSSLMETLGRAQLSIWPDYVVTVEREIHCREESQYVGLEQWNNRCTVAHQELFARTRLDLPAIVEWIKARFQATIYEDPYSPFCLIAQSNGDADAIHAYLETYCRTVRDLAVVRNDIYARFSHASYNKGSALAEIARRLKVGRESIIAAGDHWNDLPMLRCQHAKWLIAPGNAIPPVKEAVLRQQGFVAEEFHGHGVARGLERITESFKASVCSRDTASATV